MNVFHTVKSWFANIGKKDKTEIVSAIETEETVTSVAPSVQDTEPSEVKNQKSKKKASGKGNTFVYICQWIFKLRGLFMAIPVLFASIVLAVYNKAHLPEKIAVYFPTNSGNELAVKMTELSRETAVTLPLLITIACLILMCCSRRTVYPWIISIFSLVLPLFFLFTGMYLM